MHDKQRAQRQIDLFIAIQDITIEQPVAISKEAIAILVLAARVEEFSDAFGENIHRAGEGV